MLRRIFFISLTLGGFSFLVVTGGCRSDITAQIELAQVREKDGYYQQAESIYQTITADRPGTSEALAAQKNLVILYFKMNRCRQASQALGWLIKDYSKHSGLLDSLHEIVSKYRYGSLRGIPGEAVEAWHVHQRIQHYIDSPDVGKGQLAVRAMNAMILTELHPAGVAPAIDKLIADFSKHPDLPRALWYIAEKHTKLKEYEKANSIYRKIAQCDPDSSYAGRAYLDFQKSHILFLIESEQGTKTLAAIHKLSTDFRDCPGLLSTLDDIAGKYESLEEYDNAVAVYNTIIKVDPHSELAAGAQRAIGWTYVARGMYDRAIQEYRKVLDNFPESVQLASTQYWIAQSYYRKREFEQAKEEYQKVIHLYPESRSAIYSKRMIARIYILLNMYDQAISEHRKIVENYPDSGWAPYSQCGVAQSYYGKRDLERAIDEYQKVIKEYPASQAADSAEEQITRIKNIKSMRKK